MSASVTRQECDLAAFERAQDISIRRIAEWSLLPKFAHVGKARHGIEPAPADDANFRFRQISPSNDSQTKLELKIIQAFGLMDSLRLFYGAGRGCPSSI